MKQKSVPQPKHKPVRINIPYWEMRKIAAAITEAAAAGSKYCK